MFACLERQTASEQRVMKSTSLGGASGLCKSRPTFQLIKTTVHIESESTDSTTKVAAFTCLLACNPTLVHRWGEKPFKDVACYSEIEKIKFTKSGKTPLIWYIFNADGLKVGGASSICFVCRGMTCSVNE